MQSTKVKIEKDLRKYAVASIQPEVIDPTSFYIIPKVYVYYNANGTALSGSQLATKILQSIDEYNRNGQTDRFNNRIEGSKFGAMVDNSDTSISGNVTQLTLGQNLDKFAFGNVFTQCLNFGNPFMTLVVTQVTQMVSSVNLISLLLSLAHSMQQIILKNWLI